jgi:hypothetical protein
LPCMQRPVLKIIASSFSSYNLIFLRNCSHSEFLSRPVRSEVTIGQFLHLPSVCHVLQKLAERTGSLELHAKNCYMRSVFCLLLSCTGQCTRSCHSYMKTSLANRVSSEKNRPRKSSSCIRIQAAIRPHRKRQPLIRYLERQNS